MFHGGGRRGWGLLEYAFSNIRLFSGQNFVEILTY